MSTDGIYCTGSSALMHSLLPPCYSLRVLKFGGGMANIADQFTDVLQANGQPYSYFNAQDGFLNFADFEEERPPRFEAVAA